MMTSSQKVFIFQKPHAKRLCFICVICHCCILKNVGTNRPPVFSPTVNRLSGRWQAPAAVLPEGPKNIGDSHSRARRAREWPKHASPRARRARGRAKLSLRFGACQCYYMFFTIQPKIAIFMAQFKYLNDGQNA